MANYNFTVRATDNLGAFADQNFSLTVNNTNIERFVMVGSSGLAHSSDGANWTIEAGQSGGRVAYGNGKWVVYGGSAGYLAGSQIRTSTDAFNWTTLASGIPATYTGVLGGTSTASPFTIQGISSLKYQNGLWTAFCWTAANGNGPNNYTSYTVEYNSPDLVNWTFKSALQSFSTTNSSVAGYANDHYIDANGLCVIVISFNGAMYTYYRTAAANTLTQGVTIGTSLNGAATPPVGQVSYTSGLFAVTGFNNPGSLAAVYTSIDGIGWTARTVAAVANAGVASAAYANGRLVARVIVQNSAAAQPTYYSLNGGRSWLQGGNTAAMTGTLSSFGNSMTQNIAYYAGRLIFIDGSATVNNGANYNYSTDNGTTWIENNSIGNSIGTALAIGVRI